MTRHKSLFLVLAVILLGAAALVVAQIGTRAPGISVQDALQLINKDSTVVLLDVRTPQEFRGVAGRLKGALLIPVHELESRLNELAPFKGRTILVYCRTGNRSGRATSILVEKGFRALNLEGGIVDWSAQNLPIVREEQQ